MSYGTLPWTLPTQLGNGPGAFTGHGALTATARTFRFTGHGALTATAHAISVNRDAVGAGDGEWWGYGGFNNEGNYFSNFLYWTHNATAGATVLATVVATSGASRSVAPAFLAKYGQTPMRWMGSVPLNNVAGNGILALFMIENVPGPATITIDINPAQTPAWSTRNGSNTQAFVNFYMAGTSASYTNAAPIRAAQVSTVYGTGTSPSQSLIAGSGEMAVQAFANRGAGILSSGSSFLSQATATNRTPISVYTSVGISDAAATTTFSGTIGASDPWAGIGIVLEPRQGGGAYLSGHGQLSVTCGAPPVETLVDNFAFADTTKWTFHGGATVSGGQLSLTPTTSGSYIASKQTYSIFNSAIGAKLVTPPNVGNGGTETYICLTEDLTFQNCIKVYWNNSNIYYTQTINGVTSTPFTVEGIESFTGHFYTAGDYIQVYADMGMYWPLDFNFWNPILVNVGNPPQWATTVQTGNGPPGAITPGWHDSNTGCAQINVTNVYVVIGADYTGTEPSPGTAVWSNVNVYPTLPKTSTLLDNFGQGQFGDFLWNWSLGQNVCTVSSNQLNVPADAGGSWIITELCYDMRESSLSLELVQTLNQADGAHNATNYGVWFGAQTGCWDKAVSWELVNNGLCARNYWASNTENVVVPFSSATKFVRIRESLGVFYWDTSPDSVTWTNQRTAKLGWRPYTGQPSIQSTSFNPGTSGPQTNIADKLNVATTWDPSAVLFGTGTLSATATVGNHWWATCNVTGTGRLTAGAAETGGNSAKLPWILPIQLGTSTPSRTVPLAGHGALSVVAFPLGGATRTAALSGHGALSAPTKVSLHAFVSGAGRLSAGVFTGLITVPPSRSVVVALENRTVTVPIESRTVVTVPESRTAIVRSSD